MHSRCYVLLSTIYTTTYSDHNANIALKLTNDCIVSIVLILQYNMIVIFKQKVMDLLR